MGSIPTSIFEYMREKLFFIFLGKEGFHDAITRVNQSTKYACTNDAHVHVIRAVCVNKVKPVSDFNDSLVMKVSDIPNNSVSGCSPVEIWKNLCIKIRSIPETQNSRNVPLAKILPKISKTIYLLTKSTPH